jgi:hypothetical protein
MDQSIINTEEKASAVEELALESATSSGITTSGTPMPLTEPPGEGEPREIAYTMNIPGYGNFDVLHSWSAWWLNVQSLRMLTNAYKAGATDYMACIQAGISLGQLRHFKKLHPEFLHVKEACKAAHLTPFMNTLNESGKDDLTTVRWVLSKRHEDFNDSEVDKPPEEVPLKPTVITQNNVQINVNDADVAGAMRELARILAGGDAQQADAIVADAKEVLSQEQPS